MIDLPSENEIFSRIESDWSHPTVSFLCITYNQKDYIEQTIIGFLSQKTSFPYEILIHDDCSEDGTQDIIENYRLKYPNIIRCIYQTENKYSQGISPIIIGGKACKSDYIALCEGDDYWINENKIENQFRFMISDDSISMVVSPGKLEFEGRILKKLDSYYGEEIITMSSQDVLNNTGHLAQTASYLLKREYLVKAREFFIEAPVGDLFIELYSTVFGKLMYYPEIGSVYRIRAKNSWSERMDSGKIGSQLKFISSMEKVIIESRIEEGFKYLDWSIKLSSMYYILSIYYLKAKKYKDFSKAIEKSYNYSVINKQQENLFRFRKYISIFYDLSRPLIYLRRKMKKIIMRY